MVTASLCNVAFCDEGVKLYDRNMLVGVSIALTDETVRPWDVAQLAEERGFDSLFVTEHTHVPAGATAFRNGVQKSYLRTLDPLIALTSAAASTARIRLGTSVFLASQHEPIATAKAIASLDVLSGGRVELGVGAGWVEQELANHGVAFDRRFGHLREHVEAMRAIWRDEEAAFDGEHVQFDGVMSWPKPVQLGGPPVFIGGDGPKVLDRVLAWGDGWLPRAPGGLDELAPRVRELRERCVEARRDPLPVTLYGAAPDPASLEAYAELGLHQVLLRLPSAGVAEVEVALDELADAVDRVPVQP